MHNEILQGGVPGTTMTRRWRWREAEHKLWARPQHQRDQGKQSASMKLKNCLVDELICNDLHRVVWPSNSSLQSFDTLLFGFPGLDFLVALDRNIYELSSDSHRVVSVEEWNPVELKGSSTYPRYPKDPNIQGVSRLAMPQAGPNWGYRTGV